MKMQNLPTMPRSVLLTVLLGFATTGQVAAQDTPAPAAPPAATAPATAPAADANAAEQELPAAETSQNENAPPPLPGEGEVATVTRSDGEILQALKVLSEAEIAQAEIAVEEASSQEVKDAAQQVIEEHSNTIAQIDTLVTRVGVSLAESPLSTELLERSEATTDELQALSGAEFECVYLKQEADDHQFALDTVDRQLLPFASSFSVRNFLAEAAPKFEQQAVAALEIRGNLADCG